MKKAKISPEREELIKEWSDALGYPISESEYLAIGRTLTTFFETLNKWDRASDLDR